MVNYEMVDVKQPSIEHIVGYTYEFVYSIVQLVYFGAGSVGIIPIYYTLLAGAHIGVVLGAAAALGLLIIGAFAGVFSLGAVLFWPALVLLGPFGAAIGLIAAGLAFSALAFAALIPTSVIILVLYAGKWIWIGFRDIIILPIFSPAEVSDEVVIPGTSSTGAVIEEQDPAAVVEAIDCEYEPDDPSCQQFNFDDEEDSVLQVDQFGNEITDQYELNDVNAGNPGLMYQLDNFISNLDFDPSYLITALFPNGLNLGDLSLDI